MWVKEKNKRLYELCKGFPPRDAEETHMGFPRLAEGMSLRLIEWLYDRPAESTVAWRGSERLTIAQLRLEVAALSAWMASQTARRWALCLDDAYSFTVALLACWHFGMPVVWWLWPVYALGAVGLQVMIDR